MITAIIFSLTGLGVLQIAQFVQLDSQLASHHIENDLEIDSYVNIALWRLNAGADTLASFSSGGVSCIYDTTAMELVVTTSSHSISTSMRLPLEEDYHFQRALGSQNSIIMYSYSINESSEHRPRENFEFLPEVDEAYWLTVADSVYADESRLFHDSDLIEGILVFTGNDVKFEGIDLENTTMVFTGHGDIDFRKSNTLKAAYTDSTIFPALVFTDSTSIFFINEWFFWKDHIEGAIYSTGNIILRLGELSGPVVARNISLWQDMNFLDDQYPQYYGWPEGFGEYDSYDWPKQIVSWKSN